MNLEYLDMDAKGMVPKAILMTLKTRQAEGSQWKAAGSRLKAADELQKEVKCILLKKTLKKTLMKKFPRELVQAL